MQQISFATWNIHGLSKQLSKLKNDDFIDTVRKYDCIALLETWHTDVSNIQLDGYSFLDCRTKRQKKRGRNKAGIILFVRNNIRSGVTKVDCVTPGTLWVKFNKTFFGLENDLYMCHHVIHD